jgi:para-nitrobenzyl esterase
MKRFLVSAAMGTAIAAVASLSAMVPEQVRIDTGLLQGTKGVTAPAVRIFKGIPYAAPPLGENRWRAPQPAARWEGVRMADTFGNRCMSGVTFGAPGGGRGGRAGAPNAAPAAAPVPAPAPAPPAQPPLAEDCLYANVWTSAASASDRRPVMVWIYGGGFTGGAGSEQRYDGERLAAKGPIVVTFNYRLGTFGFFAHPELARESGRNAAGNYGVMDAIAMLQWVKRNIAAFGGDPNNVTLFGESAGAIMISSLAGSPQAKGLFHRMITQSGAWMGLTMAKMAQGGQAQGNGAAAADKMGVKTLAELRAKPATELSALGTSGLVVDGYIIPEDVSITVARGRQHDVDLLSGSNSDEGTFFPGGPAATFEGFRARSQQRYGELSDNFLKLYPVTSDTDAAAAYLMSYADETSWNMRQSAVAQEKKGKKAFVYYFTRVPRQANGQLSPRGATHTAEIQYPFNNPTGLNWDDTDRKIADLMSSYWANFATKGDPNGAGLPKWPQFKDMTAGRVMVFGDSVHLESAPPAAKLSFYDSAYARQMRN